MVEETVVEKLVVAACSKGGLDMRHVSSSLGVDGGIPHNDPYPAR